MNWLATASTLYSWLRMRRSTATASSRTPGSSPNSWLTATRPPCCSGQPPSTTDIGLAGADVIIAGGAGCDASSWHLVEELAETLGGRVAASRGAVEAGLAPRALQVGQTGTTVHPLVYIACGISGALQHAVGMRTARTVLAINRDPDAFIFHLAHFGIVADVRDALPQLIAALRRTRR
jgi:electron transfer flavoprotein alpha subunit